MPSPYSYLTLYTSPMFSNRHFVTFHIKLAQRPLNAISQSELHDTSTDVFSLSDEDIQRFYANLLNTLNRNVRYKMVKYITRNPPT
jgi:hypothetical protein